MPLNLRILKTLTASLELAVFGYDYGNGWEEFPLVGKVFRGRLEFGDSDPIPMLSVLESPIPPDQLPPPEDAGLSSGAWQLLIQGFCDEDPVNPTDPAHHLMAVTKARLAVEKRRNREFNILGLGNHVTGLNIGKGVVRPPDEISDKAYFWLTISLDMVEDLTDPYEYRPRN